jgi:hypothetical protein
VAGQVDAGAEVVVVFVVEVCNVVVGVEAHVDEPAQTPLVQVRSPSQPLSFEHEAPIQALAAPTLRIATLESKFTNTVASPRARRACCRGT